MPTEAGRHQPGSFGRSVWVRKALRFSFPFCLKGVALPGLETSIGLQSGARGSAVRRSGHGKAPATTVGSGFPGGMGVLRGPSHTPSRTRAQLWEPHAPPYRLPLLFYIRFETAQSKQGSGFPAKGRNA